MSAEPSVRVRRSSTKITTTSKEYEGQEDGLADDEEDERPRQTAPKDAVKSVVFGSRGQSGLAGCKTEDLSKTVVKDLKSDCSAWLKDQKTDLKSKYLSGSCEDQCEDCGMSLRRCHVVGTMHYLLK